MFKKNVIFCGQQSNDYYIYGTIILSLNVISYQ